MAKATKAKSKKATKSAPAKPVKKAAAKAKPAAKKAAPKAKAAAPKKAVKKAAPAKAKPAAKKAAKPAAKKVAAKAPAKKTAASPKPVKKAAVKPAPKKVVSKPASKKIAPAKPEAKKAAPKAVEAKVKKVEEKVVKPVVETKPEKPKAEKPVVTKPAPVPPNPMIKTGKSATPVDRPKKIEPPVMERDKARYSKEDLEEFRVIINEKLVDAKEEYRQLSDSLKESNEMAADGYNMTEFGSDSIDKEQNEMFLVRQKKFIQQLEAALVRIENGTYGRCKVTGKLIPKERLRLVPHTESSMEAKMLQKDAPPRQYTPNFVPSNTTED